MSFIQTMKDRWKAETPIAFKWIQHVAVSLGSSATAVWGANSLMGLQLPHIVLDVCKYTIAGGFALGLGSQFTKKKDSSPS